MNSRTLANPATMALAMLLTACVTGGAAQRGPASNTPGVSKPADRGTLSAATPVDDPAPGELVKYIPHDARAAVLLQGGMFGWYQHWLDSNPEMKADLQAFLTRTAGVDLTAIEGVAMYGKRLSENEKEADVAIFVKMTRPGQIKGKPAGRHRGVTIVKLDKDFFASALPSGLVMGAKRSLKSAIDLSQRRIKPVRADDALGVLTKVGGSFVIAADRSILEGAKVDKGVHKVIQQFGLQSALVAASGQHMRVSVWGDPALLKGAKMMLMGLAKMGLVKVKAEMTQAAAGSDVGKGVGAIIAYHQAHAILKEIEPRLDGNELTSRYGLMSASSGGAEMMTMTAMAGILAAVAIPAFVKYQRKAKTIEAVEGLDKIKAGANAYYRAHRRFPPSVSWTPGKSCCAGPTSPKCKPGRAFAHPTWKALHFAMTDPHYYQYRFTSKGRGHAATFTIEARGDLDCDREMSSYKVTGRVGNDGFVTTEGPIISNDIE